MQAAFLPDRGVLKVSGDEARSFLDRIVTTDIDGLTPARPRFSALLTPQGKIIADFIVVEASPADGGGFFLDCPRALAHTLISRLSLYKLRAKVAIEDLSATLGVMAVWDGSPTEIGRGYPDPRLPALGLRVILPPETAKSAATALGATLVDETAYEAHRIAHGIPRGGLDFVYGDAYPHETDMDQLGGIDFDKGCYVGQEVISRIEHRSTARARVVPITYNEFSPQPGSPVMAGDKTVGTLGSTAAGRGLALLRLDRVETALDKGVPLDAGGIAITLEKPTWARFRFPGDVKTTP